QIVRGSRRRQVDRNKRRWCRRAGGRIAGQCYIFDRPKLGSAICSTFKLDLEILLFELELRNGVLLHQIDDCLDIFQIHKLLLVEPSVEIAGLWNVLIKQKSSSRISTLLINISRIGREVNFGSGDR